MTDIELIISNEYKSFITEVKSKLARHQIKAAVAVNSALIDFYLELGKMIADMQTSTYWGDKLIDQMSSDLKKDFPGIAGFSRTNLYYMKKCFLYFKEFAVPDNFVPQLEGQTDPIIVPQLVRQLPWGHIKVIISKIKDNSVALFYISEIINNNWSRDTLELQIKSDLYNRKGRSINDFRNTLPEPQFAGKMNFYLSAVDSLLKAEGDNPTIGIMLCRDKNNIETEFALRDINKPMGISEFQLTGILPENLKSSLPSIEEIEREINMVREKMAKYG